MVKVAFESTEAADIQPSRNKKPAKRSRWFLKFSMLLIIAVVAAPSVLSLSGSLPMVMRKVHPKLGTAVTFDSVRMHWWSPVEVSHFKLLDLSQPQVAGTEGVNAPILCEADLIITAEPLWRIALNVGRGTGVVLKSPRVNLIADDQGTNIDRTLAELFGESTDTTADRFPFRVTVENGAVQLNSQSQFSVLNSTLTSSAESTAQNAATDSHHPALANPVIADVTEINGTFSTMDTSRWLPAMKLSASIRQSTARNVTKQPTSRTSRIAAGLDELTTDFADVPLEELIGNETSGDREAARIQIYLQPDADDKGRQAIQIGARDVDLRLVQPFLSMLGIDAVCNGMVSGGIDARLGGAELRDGVVGKIMLAGDEVRIRRPEWAGDEWLPLGTVNVSGALAVAQDGLLIQDLDISTSVAELKGKGELRHKTRAGGATASQSQSVELHGTIDLARIASSLRKTMALHDDVTIQSGKLIFQAVGSAGIANETGSNVTAESRATQTGTWSLNARVDGLQATRAGKPLQADSNMKLDADGPFTAGIPELLRARLTANFGTIDCVPDREAWKVSGLVHPSLLWESLQQFADVAQPGIRGDVNFQSRVAMLNNGIQLTELQLNSSEVKVSSSQLTILPANSFFSMLDGNLHVEGLGAAIRTLLLPWGDASFLADQAQIVANLTASQKSEIRMEVRITPTGIAAMPHRNVKAVSQSQTRFTSARASIFVIDEAELNLNLTASNEGRQFDISNGVIKLPGLSADVSGTIFVPDDTTLLDLTADTSYDLDILSHRLFAADSGLVFSGQGRDRFKLKGVPAVLRGDAQQSESGVAAARRLEGSGIVQWSSAKIFGLNLGGGSVQATLENSLLRAAPIQCALNGGQANVMGQYDFALSRLELGAGSRVENISVTTELCREWLRFVAPMLADAADVNGRLSMRVEKFLWNLNTPQDSDVAGKLTIHEASAAPGASFASLLQVVDLLQKRDETNGLSSRSLTLPEQTVPVQVRQGYVMHDALMMDLAGYRLKSTGAVGMNEQLQITLDVPLEKGTTGGIRTMKVPLRGTVKSPQLDTASLIQNLGIQKIQEQLGTEKLQRRIGTEIDQTLSKGIDKLLNRL